MTADHSHAKIISGNGLVTALKTQTSETVV